MELLLTVQARLVTWSVMLLAVPMPTHAQLPEATRWSAGVSLGEGAHARRAGDVYYETSSSNNGTLWVAYRLGSSRVRPVLRAELLTEGPGSDTDDCPIAPDGSCARNFPAPDGAGIAAGAAVALTTRLEAAILAGVGRFDATTRRSLAAEGVFTVARRLGIVVGGRYMTWNEPRLGRHWFRPLHAGMQLRW